MITRFPGFQNSKGAAKAVAKLLRSSFWLPTLSPRHCYERLQDDHDGKRWGVLRVTFSDDADAWVEIDKNGADVLDGSIRFRVPIIGGGMSPRTRTALLILAEAMRLDAEEAPQDMSSRAGLETRAVREICAKPLDGVDAGDLCERQEGHTGNCGLDPI